ncbi:MAG: hypothetical protein CO029_03185 [Candidatus Magasanikbacteria bacterium CG_4_9_14_0_2_um_filter_41_10]|nr:MAG: hypothetical protein CO029_03185 [Candidatus Magasanikbacteria bacterium CG_4_9_14_0_2_um_filter_41_10]
MKKIIVSISALFGVVFLAGCSQQATNKIQPATSTPLTQQEVQPSANPEPTTSTTSSDSHIYQDQQYGFEFEYAGDAVTKETPSNRWGTGVGYRAGHAGDKGAWSVSAKENTSDQTLQQAFDENYNTWKSDAMSGADFKLKDLYISDIKVDGKEAKELYIDNFGDVGSTMVSVVNSGNVYMIAGGQKKGDLDQFLSTFKFTK